MATLLNSFDRELYGQKEINQKGLTIRFFPLCFFMFFCLRFFSLLAPLVLRSGAFYSWPMLYGWIYPQLMMVLMIMVTYCLITPLLMPFCAIFFAGAYIMYKYQLLYVYVNEYQSGGYMWYAVFNRSLIALEFASVTLIGKKERKDP
jgi:hypothetical protein